MNYLTSKQLSEKWGIGQCRIILLAREGRIPGAKLYGKTWLFPEDATKPPDGRTKASRSANGRNKKVLSEIVSSSAPSDESLHSTITYESSDEAPNNNHFRFPNFEYKDAASFNPPLSAEELALKAFVECFISCRFEKAEELLATLPENSQNRYLRIHALYCGCMLDIMCYNTKRFLSHYERLQTELAEDFPHKEEMIEFLYEIEATLGLDEYYAHEFNLKPAYYYHESFLPRVCNLTGFCLTLSETNVSATTLKACEMICHFLEKTDNYFDLQSVHIYLGIAYAFAGRTDERDYHFKRALTLAQEYDMFYNLATQYFYLRKEFTPALKEFPVELKKKLLWLGNDIRNRLTHFSEAMQLKNIYAMLVSDDYIYVVYAVRGLTNKEVASRAHVSIGAVGKKYSDIYALLGVKNKADLVDLYHSIANAQPQ